MDEAFEPFVGVCAVVAPRSEISKISVAIDRLSAELLLRRDLPQKTIERLRRRGFHATEDIPDVQAEFLRLIKREAGYKAHVVYGNVDHWLNLSKKQAQAIMVYELTRDVLRQNIGASSVHMIVESAGDMDKYVRKAVEAARDSHTFKAPPLTIDFRRKNDPPALALPDYLLYWCLRWLNVRKSGKGLDLTEYEARSFAAFLGSISMIRSIDGGSVKVIRRDEVLLP